MNKQQYEFACDIVRVNCTGQGRFRDGQGNTCAIGSFYAVINPDWACNPIDEPRRGISTAVQEVFDLTREEVWDIEMANDLIRPGGPLVESIEARRGRVLKCLKEIYQKYEAPNG